MSYTALEGHFRRLSQLEHVEAIASWDEAAMMPAGGGTARGAALATLKGLIHDESSAPRVGEWIAAAESRAAELSPWQVANLREIRRGYVRATALPTALVEASAAAHSKSEQAWRKLRPANDWHALLSEDEAFYLRVASPGEYRYLGADLGVLVTRGRMQTNDQQLTERCHRWLRAVRAEFAGTPAAPAPYYETAMAFKGT